MLTAILIWVNTALIAANVLLAWINHRQHVRLMTEYGFNTETEDTESPCKPRMTPAHGQRRQGK